MGIQGNYFNENWEINLKTKVQNHKVESVESAGNGFTTSFQIFSQARIKRMINLKKTIALRKLFQIKAKTKRTQLLQARKEKLEKFRINYIPLCSDEDWEMMAFFYSKNSKR